MTKERDKSADVRRHFAAGTVVVATAVILASCSGLAATPVRKANVAQTTAAQKTLYDQAKGEGKLLIYTDDPVTHVQATIAAFDKKYPGIKVSYVAGGSAANVERTIAEYDAHKVSASLEFSTNLDTHELAAAGAIQKYHSPYARDLPSSFRSDQDEYTTYALSLATFSWNTKLVPKSEVPKTWAAVLNPRWKGLIGLEDPTESGGAQSLMVTLYKYWGAAKWTAYLQKFQSLDPVTGTYFEMEGELTAGLIDIQWGTYPDYVDGLKAAGASVDWGVPNPVYYIPLVANVTAHAPDPAAAQLYLNFITSPSGQRLLGKIGYVPAITSALPKAYAKRLKHAHYVPAASALQVQKAAFFSAEMEKYFG